MNKVPVPFYPIPKVVYDSPLSPCAKLLFTYLAYVESFLESSENLKRGEFFQCYLRTLADKLGKSPDSVRKSYIPELVSAGLIDKRTIGGVKGDNYNTYCLFRIKWENITAYNN